MNSNYLTGLTSQLSHGSGWVSVPGPGPGDRKHGRNGHGRLPRPLPLLLPIK